jgi:arylsulfatase
MADRHKAADALGLGAWQEPFEELRAPTLTNLRVDQFERAGAEDAMGCQPGPEHP